MTNSYVNFDTTPANLVADLKTNILLSSDWSNPAGSRVVSTATSGADMVVDLADASASAIRMQLGVYRTAALADKVTRYLTWRTSGGATSDPLHVTLACGKDFLFFSVEGPRAGETNAAETNFGSVRQCFLLADIIPYFAGDTTAAVALVAPVTQSSTIDDRNAYISRNQANGSSWVTGRLLSLQPPLATQNAATAAIGDTAVQRVASGDGNTYVWPYVVVETTAGLRGRLRKVFFAGFNFQSNTSSAEPVPVAYGKLTYNSETYVLLPVQRATQFLYCIQALGRTDHSSNATEQSPVIAVPCT